MSKVRLSLQDNQAVIRPAEYLAQRFDDYRKAVTAGGGRFDPKTKTNVAAVEYVPSVVEKLRMAGFEVEVEEPLAERLRAVAAAAAASRTAAVQRTVGAEEELRSRGLVLYPFQKIGVRWLSQRFRALLADEMGLGKTVQGLMAIPANSPVLVVCPASLKRNWENETHRWRPDLAPGVLSGTGAFAWPADGGVLIINPDILPPTDEEAKEAEEELREDPRRAAAARTLSAWRSFKVLGPAPKGLVVIVDEAQMLKTPKARRTQRFRQIRDMAERVWLITGTPMMNRPPELWAVLEAASLARECFGSWKEFMRLFRAYKGRFSIQWGKPSEEVPQLLQRVSLMRRRADVLPDLPKKQRAMRVVEIDAKTAAACDAAAARLKEKYGINIMDAALSASKMTSLAFEEISEVRAMLATAKIPALDEVCAEYEDAEIPLVLFSAHLAPLRWIAENRPGWAFITGETEASERQLIVERFQQGQLKGIGGTIKAMGVGLTLTRAAHELFVDREWTPAWNDQAEARCIRIGATADKVMITDLVANHPLDRRVTELNVEKTALIDQAVNASARGAEEQVIDVADEMVDAARGMASIAPPPVSAAGASSLSPVVVGPRALEHREGCRTPPPSRFRQAKSPTEVWAKQAILALAAADSDRARVQNGMGFNRIDGSFGHSLADDLKAGRGLSEAQWGAAVRLAMRYPKQVGRP